MPKRIFVHIGRAKTGSTALQFGLSQGRPALGRRGFVYPSRLRNHAFIVYSLKPELTNHLPPAKREMFAKMAESLREEIPTLERDVIISSEGLSNQDPERVAEWLGGGDVWIVVYLREQARWLASAYQQIIQQRSAATMQFPDYARRAVSTTLYGDFLDKWASVFGRERIIARVYDRELLVGKDIVTDFLSILGIDDTAPFLESRPTDNNPSIAGALLEAKRRINELGFGTGELLDATYGVLRNLANENRAYTGLVGADPHLVEEIRETCRESNLDVARRYFGRTELFPLSPFPPNAIPDESQVQAAMEAIIDRAGRRHQKFAVKLSRRLNAAARQTQSA